MDPECISHYCSKLYHIPNIFLKLKKYYNHNIVLPLVLINLQLNNIVCIL